MFKSYLIKQMTQISAWVGFFIALSAFLHLPHFLLFTAGVLLMLTDDKRLQKIFASWSPAVKWALDIEA